MYRLFLLERANDRFRHYPNIEIPDELRFLEAVEHLAQSHPGHVFAEESANVNPHPGNCGAYTFRLADLTLAPKKGEISLSTKPATADG